MNTLLRVVGILTCVFHLCSCQSTALSGTSAVPPEKLKETLKRGKTTRAEILDWLGEPLKKRSIKKHEVWTYQWLETEERSAYAGTKIGEERSIFDTLPGYTHILTRKTILNLIFTADGRLNNYQITEE
jgi:hypothetical protein